ncbi:hypothetical protein BgAZ_204670 [Babesia gibsoni]|uniref:Uncharacterized protein n=1 Tax=Babesia gibsoni TaxID=33632 RepID=A0AAD8LRE1_BABGI|nr:hypothetical protein BgAZ_204670 [Babesia gibsoni]
MVEIYRNKTRCAELEAQLVMDWNLDLPNDVTLCKDILKSLELAMSKLEESNEYLRSSLETEHDPEIAQYIEENEVVLRRKDYQVKQVKSHIDSLQRSCEAS